MAVSAHLTRSHSVAANIRAEMARRGMAQREVAEQLGISQAAFSARMSGRTPIDVNELGEIAQILGVSITSLMEEAE